MKHRRKVDWSGEFLVEEKSYGYRIRWFDENEMDCNVPLGHPVLERMDTVEAPPFENDDGNYQTEEWANWAGMRVAEQASFFRRKDSDGYFWTFQGAAEAVCRVLNLLLKTVGSDLSLLTSINQQLMGK